MPSVLRISSVVGPAMAGPQDAANPVDTCLASRFVMAALPGIAVDVATRPPQANAVSNSSGGSRSR